MENKEKIRFDSIDQQFLKIDAIRQKVKDTELPKKLQPKKKNIGSMEDLLNGQS